MKRIYISLLIFFLIYVISDNQMNEAIPSKTIPVVQRAATALPTDYAHAFVQKALLNQMKRNKLQVKPTIDDLRAANNELDVQQKRVNREYDEALKLVPLFHTGEG